jgi:hypothetical protein
MNDRDDHLLWAVVKAFFSILGVAIFVLSLRLRSDANGVEMGRKPHETWNKAA